LVYEIQHTFYVQKIPPPRKKKCTVCDIMWKNMVQPGEPQKRV